jgi:hypothetical protein
VISMLWCGTILAIGMALRSGSIQLDHSTHG